RPADCHFANFDFLKHIPSRQKRGEGRDSCFEMQYHRANPVRGRKMAAVQYRWLLRQQVTGISQLPPRLALQERKLQEVVECA
ncbi:hypothetical protein ACQ7BU_18215, partial [Escherichia coli]